MWLTRSREGRSREWEEARAPPALRTGPTRAHAADLSAAEVGVTGYCQRLWIPTRGNQDVVPGKGRPPKEHRARDGQSFCGQCCIWTVWSGSPLAAGGGGWGLRDDINGITAVWVHHGRPPPPPTPSLVPPGSHLVSSLSKKSTVPLSPSCRQHRGIRIQFGPSAHKNNRLSRLCRSFWSR